MSPSFRIASCAVAIACSASLASCGDRSPTAPGPDRSIVQGTWVGTVNDQLRGAARVRLSVAGFGESALGSFTMTFADTTQDLAGDVTISTIDRPRLDLFFRVSAAAGCPDGEGMVLHARATLATPDQISGNYMNLAGCASPRRGTLELAR